MKPLFIHIPKTGGRALKGALSDKIETVTDKHLPREYKQRLVRAMNKHGLSPQYGHCRWQDLRPEYQDRKAVAIVRNPWSRTVSQYLFAQKVWREHPKRRNATSVSPDTSFEEFVALRNKWGYEPFFWHRTTVGYYPQVSYVVDTDGRLRCDILRFEHYAEDVQAYFRVNGQLPRRNDSSGGKDYREFYTDNTRLAIEQWCQYDIEAFGFDFESPATRNVWASKP